MEIYDYQDTPNHFDEMGEKIDTLSNQEAQQVSDFIDSLKAKEMEKQTVQALDWFNTAILPALQEYAMMTASCLTIESNDDIMVATLENRHGLDITESCRVIRALISLANHIDINAKGETALLTLIFNCSNFIG